MNETMRSQGMGTDKQSAPCSSGRCPCTLEGQMSKIPSDAWMWAALGSIGVSLFLKVNGRKDDSLFVGEWAAPFLLIGVYTKLVNLANSDRAPQRTAQ